MMLRLSKENVFVSKNKSWAIGSALRTTAKSTEFYNKVFKGILKEGLKGLKEGCTWVQITAYFNYFIFSYINIYVHRL